MANNFPVAFRRVKLGAYLFLRAVGLLEIIRGEAVAPLTLLGYTTLHANIIEIILDVNLKHFDLCASHGRQ